MDYLFIPLKLWEICEITVQSLTAQHSKAESDFGVQHHLYKEGEEDTTRESTQDEGISSLA